MLYSHAESQDLCGEDGRTGRKSSLQEFIHHVVLTCRNSFIVCFLLFPDLKMFSGQKDAAYEVSMSQTALYMHCSCSYQDLKIV